MTWAAGLIGVDTVRSPIRRRAGRRPDQGLPPDRQPFLLLLASLPGGARPEAFGSKRLISMGERRETRFRSEKPPLGTD
jgi:hypothetical protein